MGVLGDVEDRLACAAVGDELLESHGEAVAGIAGEQPEIFRLADHDTRELGAIRRIEAAGQGIPQTTG